MTTQRIHLLAAAALTAAPLLAQSPPAQGCTPGYWKNHVERWDGVGTDDFTDTVKASLSFNAAFGVEPTDSGLANDVTLIQATALGGGGLRALARHAAAGLASADAVDYAIAVGEVIDLYRDAVQGGGSINGTKDLIAGYNERFCPLSNSFPPPPPRLYCLADQGDCPCGNDGLLGGCVNSSGLGARLDSQGSTSVVADDLELIATQLPANTSVLFLMANASQRSVFMDGLLCIGGFQSKIFRLPPILGSGPDGVARYGPGLVAASQTPLVPVPGGIRAGETWYLQTYFRDLGLCGGMANTSNALAVTFAP